MPRRQLHDPYFKKAKAEGYLARSAYKLKEINERARLFGAGSRVLDLGCAPGAWLQVAGEIVGPRGVVVGIDLQEFLFLLQSKP
jgi:23S rRNA (uridine2552-2'-O)-methyltransferase